MCLNLPTLFTCAVVVTGGVIATPVLVKGFKRRGTGIKYERNFLIQRAPQFVSLVNVGLIVFSFLVYAQILSLPPELTKFLVMTTGEPEGIEAIFSWLGVWILISGMYFMVGGWYSLGQYFSTDAEVLEGHAVCKEGLFKYVMHPIYSGIVQCLLGAALASTSIFAVLFALFAVAPLWLKRAKYEENMLLEHLGPSYKQYAEELHWRRLVPTFIPFGV